MKFETGRELACAPFASEIAGDDVSGATFVLLTPVTSFAPHATSSVAIRAFFIG